MSAGDQQVLDEILVFHRGGGLAHAATAQRLVIGQGLGLGVAAVGDRHHAVFFRDQVLYRQVVLGSGDLSDALVAVLGNDLFQFLADHVLEALGIRQDFQEVGDLSQLLLVFVQ